MSRRGAGSDDAARQRFYGRFRISADIDRQDCDARGQLRLMSNKDDQMWRVLPATKTPLGTRKIAAAQLRRWKIL